MVYREVLKDSGSHLSLTQQQHMCHHAMVGLWATSDSEQCYRHVHHRCFLHQLHFSFPCLIQTLAQPSSLRQQLTVFNMILYHSPKVPEGKIPLT